MWPLLAVAGFSLLGQMQQNKSSAKAQLQEAKAVQEANTKNFHRTLFQIGVANIQKADEIRTRTQQKADLGTQELAAAGAAANNAAASGTVGASVDIVQADVQQQFDIARAQVEDENDRALESFNFQLRDIILNGQSTLQTIRKPQTVGIGEMLLNAGIQAGSVYAMNSMSLGLGGGGNAPPGAMRG